MRYPQDVRTLRRIAIETEVLRTIAINRDLESLASLLETAMNEARAELARRGEPPDAPRPFDDPKITRIR